MAYLTGIPNALPPGSLGCSGGCGCAKCRCGTGLGEWYVRDEDEDDERRPAVARPGGRPASPASASVEGFGQVPARASQPDSIERIVRRAIELTRQPAPFGVRWSDAQRQRIGCWLLRLLWRGADDRFITAQSVLNFRNLAYKTQPDFSRVSQWLLPAYAIRTGKIASDQEIVRTIVEIDALIIDGRQKINQEFALMVATVHVRVQWLRAWVADRQRDRMSIYHCFQG